MPLSNNQQRHLKSLAHSLKPSVTVGQAGISEGLLAELDSTLAHHELIKLKVNAGDRTLRDRMIRELVDHSSAQLVQRVGNVAILYRHNPRKKTPLPLPE